MAFSVALALIRSRGGDDAHQRAQRDHVFGRREAAEACRRSGGGLGGEGALTIAKEGIMERARPARGRRRWHFRKRFQSPIAPRGL